MKMTNYTLGVSHLKLHDMEPILNQIVSLDPSAVRNIKKCREYLDRKMQEPDKTYYGINTGFGSLCNVKISSDDIEQLQENLVLSHACGLGDEVPPEIVKIMLFLKIKNFTYGHSGISMEVIERLIEFYNQDILPVVYQLGSLGASGDLAPLAHLSLPLLNRGEVYAQGEKKNASTLNFPPLKLQSKEGLALLNGTQFMSSYAVWCLLKIKKLLQWADLIAALSFEGFDATTEPFTDGIHTIRKHQGQIEVAQNMKRLLADSEMANGYKAQVQDPYSFRCIPQVHGATRDAVAHVEKIVEYEINAVTDNPLIFPDEDLILSGGNFHGQPLAINLDYLAIAIAEIANISERRTYLLISGQRGLPPFLVKSAGLDSGLMIAQYTAASIVSKNKQLCTPASVDSIVSSNGQEDHVSMGANAATKLYEVVNNTERVLAIELLNAAQAVEFRRPKKSSPILEKILSAYREKVSFIEKDRIIHMDIMQTIRFIQQYDLNP
ncbi:MAG: histidine ammonia-lyase [Chitinophagaceae bacterium]|nr:histidine ammonia-lyase [Chitinophagaceae bacterium]